jgi:D-sedoheptulose 7-phosphate isomerase
MIIRETNKTLKLQTKINNYYDNFLQAINNAELTVGEISASIDNWLQSVLDVLYKIKNDRKNIFIIGNGASCSMASHFAADLTKNACINSYAINEGALLTCFSNDYSYETAYMEMLRRYITDNDLLIAISSSGMSKNIINAAEFVRDNNKENQVLTLSGFSEDNPLRKIGTHNLYVRSNKYGVVESAHSYYLHMIIDMFMEK